MTARSLFSVCAELLDARRTRLWLHDCDRVGVEPRLHGRPAIESLGRIEIGDQFSMSSLPLRSSLNTGARGFLEIGSGVSIGHGASIAAHAHVAIGDGTVIGPFVMILDIDFHETNDHDARGVAKPIRIGRGVRIGSNVVILRGATIGDGAIIGPNSVVSRVLPPRRHASGVPARPD